MIKRTSNFLIILLAFAQLVSCQSIKESGFVIQESKLYYDNKEIGLGMPVENFTAAMGMYNRINIDSSDVSIIKNYFWKTKLINVNKHSDDDYFTIIKFNRDQKTGELSEDTESYKKVKTLEEVISKYGKYDSINEEKTPLRIQKLFIWDKLGITLAADTGNDKVIGNIHLQTLYPTKFEEFDLGLVKNFEEQNGFPLTKEVREKRKNDKKYIQKSPKKEYTGNFTYDGHMINIKNIGYTGWQKAVKELKIEGSDFDPPGDSPGWSRLIRQSSDMYITFERFSNENEYGELRPDKVGKFDCIQSIVIWNHTTYDKK